MSDEPISAESKTADAAPEAPAPADADTEVSRLKDELLRALAEQDNIRKRGERAAAEARLFAIDRFARDLLQVADNLSRALESADGDPAALKEGVAMTHQAMLDVFGRHGLKRVGAKGERFDPNIHQAVAQIPSDAPAGAIAEVMQAGWVLSDRTLRAAMVAVSAGAPAAAPSDAQHPSDGAPGANVDVTA